MTTLIGGTIESKENIYQKKRVPGQNEKFQKIKKQKKNELQ